ncbi:MAG: helix-turn-helix transcriptional regulator [Bacteroidota bacterium]
MAVVKKPKPRKRPRLMTLDERAQALASFSARVKQLMTEKGVTAAQLAARSGINQANLKKYDNDREPGLMVMIMIAKGLGVSLKELMDI